MAPIAKRVMGCETFIEHLRLKLCEVGDVGAISKENAGDGEQTSGSVAAQSSRELYETGMNVMLRAQPGSKNTTETMNSGSWNLNGCAWNGGERRVLDGRVQSSMRGGGR
jgi:hypothetical protein